MGYSISLVGKNGDVVQVRRHYEGSNTVVGGSIEATMDVTYNYSGYFHDTIDRKDGIRWLYGKEAFDCIDVLESAVEVLGTVRDGDYWKRTDGNAGCALHVLLIWAQQHPDAIFVGD